jgi:hypothetical protein
VEVLFYLRSDELYILVGDANMALFLLISLLCDVLIRQ